MYIDYPVMAVMASAASNTFKIIRRTLGCD
jgi:hypothetical protein